MTAIVLAALLASGLADPELFRPDTVLRPPGGPTIVLVSAPGSAGVSIRLSIPFVERHADAGAGSLIQRLTLRRVRGLREQSGARVEAERTPWGLSYRVSGSARDFAHLSWIVRQILEAPGTAGWVSVRAQARAAVNRERETPRGVLNLRLREMVAPSLPPPAGTPASIAALNPARLHHLWATSHYRANLSFVVVGDVPPEAVLANLLDAGEAVPPQAAASPAPSAPADPAPRPERIRTWHGEAYRAAPVDDPRSAVAAVLMGARLEEVDDTYEAWVEHWELGAETALVVTGAAYRRGIETMRARIRGLRSEMVSSITDEEIRRAQAVVESDIVLAARSLDGLADAIGWRMDASGDPGAAADYLARLERIDRAAMVAFFDDLAAGDPLVSEIR